MKIELNQNFEIDPYKLRMLQNEKGHMESFFFKLNHPTKKFALWQRFTLLKGPGVRSSVKAENWTILFLPDGTKKVLKLSLPFRRSLFNERQNGIEISLGNLTFDGQSLIGSIEDGDEKVSLKLKMDQGFGASLLPFPYKELYESDSFPKVKTVTPRPNTHFNGEIKVGNKVYKVNNWPGMMGHNWGEKSAENYVWSHVNGFDQGVDYYFEAFSAQTKIFGMKTPKLSSFFLKLPQQLIKFNSLSKTPFYKSSQNGLNWFFEAENDEFRILGSLGGFPEDFVGLRYSEPCGKIKYCLNSKIANLNLILYSKAGDTWAKELKLTRNGGAALEILSPEKTYGVKVYR